MKSQNYLFEISEKKVRNSNVELVGVTHTNEFFLKHKNFYEEKIKNSPEGIVLEQPIGGEFWGGERFFSKLGEIAYKNKIQIYQSDPVNWGTFTLDLSIVPLSIILMTSNSLDDSLLKFMAGTNLFFGTFFSTVLFHAGNNFKEIYTQIKKANVKGEKICVDEYIKNVNDLPRSLLTFGEIDRRNIKIAKGIEKICEKESPEKLTAFHGALHTKPIEFYLNYQKIREIKNAIYAPLNICGIKGVRKYSPSNSKEDLEKHNQSWELEKTF